MLSIKTGEDIFANDICSSTRMSICIPTYKHTPSALIEMLSRLNDARDCSLLVFDDGSGDAGLTTELKRLVLNYPGQATMITAHKNSGRSHARNRLEELAQTEWILFLDADMLPDQDDFLQRYLHEVAMLSAPTIVAGGFSLKQARIEKDTLLHAAQSLKSECVLAEIRWKDPGRYIFTSNILTHKKILEDISFDGAFIGWGWEDVDWGLRVSQRYAIKHIDNPATHLGLDQDSVLIGKYARSGENFARVVSKNFETMRLTSLYRAASTVRKMPGRDFLKKFTERLSRNQSLPIGLRLFALKLFRAAVYADHLD